MILSYVHKDIISLNWGAKTFFSGRKDPLIPLSKSSISFKTSDVDFDNENRFINNHKKGLYYLNKKSNSHAYYLNPYEEVFLITNQKPSSAGTIASMIRRTGLEVRKIFRWDIDNVGFNEMDEIDDGFENFLQSLNCNNHKFHDVQISFIDKERLVNLSCGKASAKRDDKRWYKLDKLETFVQDENETVKRLTYVHDESGEDSRRDYIEFIELLNIIIRDVRYYPDILKAFQGNCDEIMFYKNGGYNYKYNLVTKDREHRATVAYIGRKDEGTAQNIFTNLQGLFELDDQQRKLVVVWYKGDSTNIRHICEALPPMANDDSSIDPNSITKV